MIPSDAWPRGDRLSWSDDETFTHYNFATEPYTLTPYSADERAAAETRLAELRRAALVVMLRHQLATGSDQIRAARDSAQADREVAIALRGQAVAARAATLAQRQSVQSFAPSATYNAQQLTAVRNAVADVLERVEQLQQAFADFYEYRAAVDANAVLTDNALLWVAQLISGVIEDQQ